uniref:Protein aurora borealis n=1 Tax=Rhipicephalus appendiculatus TaxID=34631 RepID=A0A131YZA7_RHIAP
MPVRVYLGLARGNHSLMDEQRPLMSSAWSQTTLTIPPDVDLNAVLGDYLKFHAAQDKQTTSQVNHSRDSLRRKLFCNTVEAKTHTPERRESERLSILTDGSSRRPSSTPVHMALCSSPIGGGGGIRPRCSQASSPGSECMQLSPICRQARTRPLLGSPQQQQNLKLSEPGESPPSTDEDDRSDESVVTNGGAGDMSVVTAADRSDCMQLSPCASGSRQPEPL